MEDPITVRNQLRVKALIVAALPVLGWVGVYASWLAWRTGFNSAQDDILLSAMGAFCLVVVVKGLPLLRFLNYVVTLHADGLVIAKGEVSKHLDWDQIGAIKASDAFQVLGVYDRGGRLVYAVDYYAENFGDFAGRLTELWGGRP